MKVYLATLATAAAILLSDVVKSETVAGPDVERALELLDETIKSKQGSVVMPDYEYEELIGTHYILELMNISNVELAKNAEKLEQVMIEAAKVGGLTVLQSAFHQFDGKGEGATAFLVLAESHLSIHTWPELGYLAVDIFTCGSEAKAKTAGAYLTEAFGADVFVGGRLPRGIPSQKALNQMIMNPAASSEDLESKARDGDRVEKNIAEVWAESIGTEDLHKIFSNSLDDFDTLDSIESKYQLVEFIQNKESGDKCLVLDSTVQICESYNAAYSEVYVHLPVAYMHTFKTALIIGGGDALALTEILKYKSVERVVQLELDEMVPMLSEKHFGVNAHLPGRKDSDPRVEWIFGDASKTIVELVKAGERFDLLLLDISETDPSGTVSTEDFFRHVSQALSPTGVFVKNENYQAATAKLFNEYLEVIYPVPMITEQTFILGSNGTSLLLPHFSIMEENGVETSFLAHGPQNRFRQLRSMIRRYSKRGLNYETTATDAYEARTSRSPWMSNMENRMFEEQAINGAECIEPSMMPCYDEAKHQPALLYQQDWREEDCEKMPPTDDIEIQLLNLSPNSVQVSWMHPETEDRMVIIPELAPGESKKVKTFLGHSFGIEDLDHNMAVLAMLTALPQHITHKFVTYGGLHDGFYASRQPADDPKRDFRRVPTPKAEP